MVTIKKGIKVAKALQEKFKFNDQGMSKFGDSQDSFHKIHGTAVIHDTLNVEGGIEMRDRLAGALFGAPYIDGTTAEGQAALQDLKDNADTIYGGYIIYLSDASPISPFTHSEKFYFCEEGTWHKSPFLKESELYIFTDTDNDTIPDDEDLFLVEVVSGIDNIFINNVTDAAAAATADPVFELDSSGDIMIESSPAQTGGNFELDTQGDVMPAA